jgi:uncharacterized membrane protein
VSAQKNSSKRPRRQRIGFADDFRRFFLRGVATLTPTLITIFLLSWVWNQLNDKLGRHIITGLRYGVKWVWATTSNQQSGYIDRYWDHLWGLMSPWQIEVLGVVLAIILVYIVGLLVGNLIGRTLWRLTEVGVMRIPVVRAIYPAVKQITDFVLADRKNQFSDSRVVAVQPHAQAIWSIGLITGPGLPPLSRQVGQEMVTVFIPSSPTAFSGYVLVVPRESVVELPLTVEEAMRLLISGGVITPSGQEPARNSAAIALPSSTATPG